MHKKNKGAKHRRHQREKSRIAVVGPYVIFFTRFFFCFFKELTSSETPGLSFGCRWSALISGCWAQMRASLLCFPPAFDKLTNLGSQTKLILEVYFATIYQKWDTFVRWFFEVFDTVGNMWTILLNFASRKTIHPNEPESLCEFVRRNLNQLAINSESVPTKSHPFVRSHPKLVFEARKISIHPNAWADTLGLHTTKVTSVEIGRQSCWQCPFQQFLFVPIQ